MPASVVIETLIEREAKSRGMPDISDEDAAALIIERVLSSRKSKLAQLDEEKPIESQVFTF